MRKLSTIYPGRVTVDANNPDGTFKNEVTPGVSDDGTPLEEQWQQDIWGWIAHLLNQVSVVPDGVQENEATSQIYDALETAARTLWTASLTQKGTVEQATSAEAIAGSSDVVFPSVLGIRQAFNASGSAPVYACRAWVNFNGTGVVAINASGNVTSITDNGTGDYTVNFTTAMSDVNYAVCGMAGNSPNFNRIVSVETYAVGSIRINTVAAAGGTREDVSSVNLTIFR